MGISRSDMPTDVEITAIIVIVMLIISQVGLGFWQNRNTQLRIKSAVKNMGQKLEDIQQVIKDSEDKKARMKKQAEDKTQDRKQLGIELSSAIAKAVEQTINRAIEGAKRDPSLNFQNNRANHFHCMIHCYPYILVQLVSGLQHDSSDLHGCSGSSGKGRVWLPRWLGLLFVPLL